jgi:hypothetical protein
MLDDPQSLAIADPHAFLQRLENFPFEELPYGRVLAGPYLFTFGASDALLAPFVQQPAAAVATEFVVSGVEPTSVGADVVRVGRSGTAELDVGVADDALAHARISSYLMVASGRGEALERALMAMRSLAQVASPTVATDQNPAKRLAWALWQRVPLLLSHAEDAPLQTLVQSTFARVGSLFSVPSGPDAALVGATAFEARHALADDLVALWLGRERPEGATINELLSSRVAQIESLRLGEGWLPAPDEDPWVDALVTWYAATWVAAYSALLADRAPDDAQIYLRFQRSLRTPWVDPAEALQG